MSETVKVTSMITIEIKGHRLELTLGEAKELNAELEKATGGTGFRWVPYTEPIRPYAPPYPWNQPTVTFSGNDAQKYGVLNSDLPKTPDRLQRKDPNQEVNDALKAAQERDALKKVRDLSPEAWARLSNQRVPT